MAAQGWARLRRLIAFTNPARKGPVDQPFKSPASWATHSHLLVEELITRQSYRGGRLRFNSLRPVGEARVIVTCDSNVVVVVQQRL